MSFGSTGDSCFTCGLPDHFSRDFPSSRAIVVLAYGATFIRAVYPSSKDGSRGRRDGY